MDGCVRVSFMYGGNFVREGSGDEEDERDEEEDDDGGEGAGSEESRREKELREMTVQPFSAPLVLEGFLLVLVP